MPQMKMNPKHYAKMLGLIKDDGLSLPELVNETGLHKHTVAEYMHALHDAGVVHIVAWERASPINRLWSPVYKLGVGPNKRKPAPLSHAERQRRCREKKKTMEQFAVFNQLREAA